MRRHSLVVFGVALGLFLSISGEALAASVLIDDYGPTTTVTTYAPWSVVSEQLVWSGDAGSGSSGLTTELGGLASEVEQYSQFVFDLTVSADCDSSAALYFLPYDGIYHELQRVTLTAGTTTTVAMPYSLWPSFDPSNFAGYAFTAVNTTGVGSVSIDNLQATPELSTIFLYALGLVLCGIYVRMRH